MLNKVTYIFAIVSLITTSFILLGTSKAYAQAACPDGYELVDGRCECINPGPYGICIDVPLGLIDENGNINYSTVLLSSSIFLLGVIVILNGSFIKSKISERNI
jgi:hypothetical protein